MKLIPFSLLSARSRRTIAFVRTLLCGLAIAFALPALAATETVNGISWTYTISNGKAELGSGASYTPAIPASTRGTITIPSSLGGYPVTSIGPGAFYSCTNLTSVTIPAGVTNIALPCFYRCSALASIAVSAQNAAYASSNGILFTKDKTKLLLYPSAKAGRLYAVPATVTELAPYCFDHTCLVALQFTGNRPTCSETVSSGDSLVAYYPKGKAGWTKLDADEAWGESMKGILLYPIPSSGQETVRGTVYHYEMVDGIVWCYVVTNGEASLEYKPRQSGGWGHEASIPWEIRGDVTVPSSLGGYPVTRIGEAALCCGSYTSVIIPHSVREIAGDACCYNGRQLKSVMIPNSVTNIGVFAFACSYGLEEIRVENGNPFYESENGVLYKRGKRELVEAPPALAGHFSVPNTVTHIGPDAFCSCGEMTSITIPDSVVAIGKSAFYWCNDDLFDTNSIPGCQIVDGWVFTGSTHTWDPIQAVGKVDLTGLRGIVDGAFSDCDEITSVIIPSTITRIGEDTFASCGKLKSVKLPDTMTSIGDSAFYNCTNLTTLAIPAQVTNIGSYAFAYCRKLASLTLPDGVVNIGKGSFVGCSGLQTLSVPGRLMDTAMLSSTWVPLSCTIVYRGAYRVEFAANGGTGRMDAQQMIHGKAATLRHNQFERAGYVFRGWATTPGGHVVYADKASVKNLAGDGGTVTLYAKWAKASYQVNFKANGGSGTMAAQNIAYGKATALRANEFKREGCVFRGWATTAGGAVVYKNKASVKNLAVGGKVTLYAKWAKKNYTITFNANGGTGTMPAQTIAYGQSAALRAHQFTRKGCQFLGWSKTKNGAVAYKNKATVKNLTTSGKLTLYAVWAGNAQQTVGPAAATWLSSLVTEKVAWTASADVDWITVRTKSGAAGSVPLYFDVAANKGAQRTGHIIVSADDKAFVITVTQRAPVLSLSASRKVFSRAAAKDQKLGVTANVSWKAKSSAKWLTISPTSGKGKGTIVYALAANKGGGRAATITVSGGGQTAGFRVEQKGVDGSAAVTPLPAATHVLRLDPTNQTYAATATNDFAMVESDLAWKATTTNTWILLCTNTVTVMNGPVFTNMVSGRGDGVLNYRVTANSGNSRTGTVTVAASGTNVTLTIVQAAPAQSLYLYVVPTNRTATADAAPNEAIWVEANVAWTAAVGSAEDDEWVTLKTTSGMGSGGLGYAMAANTSTNSRKAVITVWGGGLAADFTLTQEGVKTPGGGGGGGTTNQPVVPYLRANPTARTYDSSAQSGAFLVEANVAWTARKSDDWIVLHTTSGRNNGQVSFSLAKNTTGATRRGVITLTGGGLTATFTVIQLAPKQQPPQPPPPPPSEPRRVIVIPSVKNVPAEGSGGEVCTVLTSPGAYSWTARVLAGNASWIHLQVASGIGQGELVFSVDPNPSKTRRTGRIRVSSGSAYAYCTVVQDGKVPYLRVSRTSLLNVPWQGTAVSVAVAANVDWTASSDASWVHVSPTSGSGNGAFTITVDENRTYSPRGPATVTVSGPGVKTQFIKITQLPKTLLELSPYPTMTITYHGGTHKALSVRSNVKWTASDDAGWITLLKTRGTGSGTIPFRVTQNTGKKARTGHITVTGGGESRTLTIVQQPTPQLKVTPTSMTVNYKEASYQLAVQANVKWKVKRNVSWITLETTSGEGDGTIVFRVSKNTTGKTRVGNIAVSGGGITCKVKVTQKREPKLSISPKSNTVKYDALYTWFYVTSDVKWTAKSDSSWVKLRNKSGHGDGTRNGEYVDFDAAANTTASNRIAKITVSGGGKTVVYTLTQKAPPNLHFYCPDDWPAAAFVTTYQTSTSQQISFTAGESPPPCVRYAWANTGKCAAGAYKVRALITAPSGATSSWTESRTSLPVNTYDKTHFYHGLSSGYSIYAAPRATGTFKVTITLDSEKKVVESNEKDNTRTVYFTVVADYSFSSRARTARRAAETSANSSVAVPASDLGETAAGAAAAADAEELPEGEATPDDDWVAVTASAEGDASAVVDGDETTGWTVDASNGAWVVLTFSEPHPVEDVEVIGDNLPEAVRILFSDDAEQWQEDMPRQMQYVWVAFPPTDNPVVVKEIRVLPE